MENERYHAIDKLRASMISIVMFGHAMLPYLTVPRQFQDANANIIFDVGAIFLYSFAMQAFFVTAGFSSLLVLDKRGVGGLIRNRVLRILLPFLVAYLLLAPVTRAGHLFANVTSATQSLQAGIDLLASIHLLRWSKMYHLWFLPALFVFTGVVLLPYLLLRQLGPRPKAAIDSLLRKMLASPWRAVTVGIIIAPAVVWAYVLPAGNARTGWLGLPLIVFFVIGWLLYRYRDLLPIFGAQANRLIAIAVLATPVTVWASRLRLIAEGQHDPIIGVVAGLGNTVLAVCMTFGLLGLFQSRLDQPSAFWRYVSDASYWIYLVHLPLVLFVAAALSVTDMPAIVKYLLTVGICLPIVLGSYQLFVNGTRLGGVLIGGRRKARAYN